MVESNLGVSGEQQNPGAYALHYRQTTFGPHRPSLHHLQVRSSGHQYQDAYEDGSGSDVKRDAQDKLLR